MWYTTVQNVQRYAADIVRYLSNGLTRLPTITSEYLLAERAEELASATARWAPARRQLAPAAMCFLSLTGGHLVANG